jgi:putative transposase
MQYNPTIHHRRSIRLSGYDYTKAGAYFVTICAQNRECLFGEITAGQTQLNEYGCIVAETWEWLSTQYDYVDLDAWIVMPNHLHGIIIVTDDHGAGGSRTAPTAGASDDHGAGGSRTAPTGHVKRKPLGRLIGAFKTVSTKRVNALRDMADVPIWQRDFYEHIIRNEASLRRIREYIVNNPLRWKLDQLHPNNPSRG